MKNEFELQTEPSIDETAVAPSDEDVIDEDELLRQNQPRVQSPYDRPGKWCRDTQ